jgi:hypothetical protein
LLDATVVDDEHWARGVGQVKLRIPSAGQSALGAKNEFTTMYFENGPLLGPAEKKDIPDFESLASFETEIRENDAPPGVMKGTTAIGRGSFGEGRVVCFSPHPEKSRGCEAFVTEAVSWAAGLASKVGQQVTLRGRFDGPGKIADYIITDGGLVYLVGGIRAGGNSLKNGTEIVVKGTLQRYLQPPSNLASSVVKDESMAMRPEHYFIEAAELVDFTQ